MSSLFERFSEKENLKEAFLYLKEEVKKSSLPLDPTWGPAINVIGQLGDDFFYSLQEFLRQKKYQPDQSDHIFAAKDNLGCRPICIFSVVDRIIFQALLNPQILGNIIDTKLFTFCLGNRIWGDESYLKPYQTQWNLFCTQQIKAFKKGFVWRIEFDVQIFYENIHIDTLIKVLKEHFNVDDEKVLNILENLLKTLAENPLIKLGIPQGPHASSVLANAYLHPLDTFINNLKNSEGFKYFRYADDIVIMGKNDEEAIKIVNQIEIFIRQYNLRFNNKTKLEKLNNIKHIEESIFYSPYSGISTSQKKAVKIKKNLPQILKKIKQGKDSDKIDISALKYYLKAGSSMGDFEILDDLITIIPKKPSLIYLICRYIGVFISDENKNFYELHKKSIHSNYERIWKIYCNDSLTEWTRFWLLKVLTNPIFSKYHTAFQTELSKIIADPSAKFLRPIAFFYKAYLRDSERMEKALKGEPLDSIELGFSTDDIKRHIKNSKTESEKAIYYYFLIYITGEKEEEAVIKDLIYEALQSKSLEVQIMGLFLVHKFYYLFNPHSPITSKTSDEKIRLVKAWKLNLNQERVSGGLSRIYYKLPDQPNVQNESIVRPENDHLSFKGEISKSEFSKILGIVPSDNKSKNKKIDNKKVNINISPTEGIYRMKGNKKLLYGIKRNSSRMNIIVTLKDGLKFGNVLADLIYNSSLQILSKEISNINKLFKEKLEIKEDLITNIKTGGYKLNKEKLNIKFD